jgi:hypothetical protein
MIGILDEIEPDYYCNARKFSSGCVEMSTKVIRPMQRAAAGERWAHFGPVSPRREVELTESEKEARALENWQRAIRRAKQNIRWLCKELGADRLFTLTYRANVIDREQVKSDWQEFLRLVRKGGFEYRAKDGCVRRAPPQKDWK